MPKNQDSSARAQNGRSGSDVSKSELVVHRATAAALLVITASGLALAILDVNGSVRLLVVAAFALTAPGWALIAFWRPATPAMTWTLAIASSIAIQIILSMIMLATKAWYPVPAYFVLALITGAALVVHIAQADRRELVTG
jgi:uncharacterized membrane protein